MLEKTLKKVKWMDVVFVLGILLIIVGIGMNFKDQFIEKSEVNIAKKVSPTKSIDIEVNREVVIDVEGEVIYPGLYKFEGEVRVNDALEMAGGLAAKADREWVKKNLNLADRLMDGQKIYIPRIGEVIENKVEDQVLGVGNKGNDLIKINSASLKELDELSGIGPALATRIIDYREENNGFRNVEELKLVSGIGDKLFEKIKDEIAL